MISVRVKKAFLLFIVLCLLFVSTACSQKISIIDLYNSNGTNPIISQMADHVCFLPDKLTYSQIEWTAALCEYYPERWIQSTFYIHLLAESIDPSVFHSLQEKALLTLNHSIIRNNRTILCSDETMHSIDLFFDNDILDGCLCFYSIAVFDNSNNSIEIWICEIDDGAGSNNSDFSNFLNAHFSSERTTP